MTHPMHELDARDREILAAFRDHEDPPPGAAERVYERVLAQVDGVTGSGVPWLRSVAISVAIAAAVLLAIRGVVTGAASLRESADAMPSQAELGRAGGPDEGQARVAKPAKPTVRRPVATPAVTEAPAPAVDPGVDPAPANSAASSAASSAMDGRPGEPPADARVEATPAPRDRPAKSTAPAGNDGSSLARDLELLATAKRTADPRARLSLLERHAREHPKSKLSEERDVLTIETLCSLGRESEAKTHARTFGERHAGSAFSARVAKSCAGAGK